MVIFKVILVFANIFGHAVLRQFGRSFQSPRTFEYLIWLCIVLGESPVSYVYVDGCAFRKKSK